jgi:hypothetical protein
MPLNDRSPSQGQDRREIARPRIRIEPTKEDGQSIQRNEAELNAFASWFADWWLRRGRHSTPDYQDKR